MGARLPRPSEPDLYEAWGEMLRSFRAQEKDGITLRAVYDKIEQNREAVTEAMTELGKRISDHEIQDANRMSRIEATLDMGNYGFGGRTPPMGTVILPAPPPVPAIPPPPRESSVKSLFGKVFVGGAEKFLNGLLPTIIAMAIAYLVGHGCVGR